MGEEATQFKSASHLQLSTSTHDDLGSMEMSEKGATDTCEPRVAMASEPTVHRTCAQTQSDRSMRNVHNALNAPNALKCTQTQREQSMRNVLNALKAHGQGLDVLFETCRDCCHCNSLFLYKSFLLEHRTCARTQRELSMREVDDALNALHALGG